MFEVGDLIEYNASSFASPDMRTWTGIILEKETYGAFKECEEYKIAFVSPETYEIKFQQNIMNGPCVRKANGT